jgi:hypothetical protein
VGAVDRVNSFLIRFHKNKSGSSSYLLFLARSVAQQAKKERAGLLLGGVGAVDGLQFAHHQLQVPARHRT